jgi:hypothetical protein
MEARNNKSKKKNNDTNSFKFNSVYFSNLPDKVRYLEKCIKEKVKLQFIRIFGLVESEKEKILIMKKFYYLFTKDVWDYLSNEIKNEKILEYFAHRVNWGIITERVIASLNSKNEDDKIFSEEFIGNNLAKLRQTLIIEKCRLSNIFIKKFPDNLNLELVAMYQNVTKTAIKSLNLNPILILKNNNIKTIEPDFFPTMNWEKFFKSYFGMDIPTMKKLAPIFNSNIKYFEIILANNKNSSELKELLKLDFNSIENEIGIKVEVLNSLVPQTTN